MGAAFHLETVTKLLLPATRLPATQPLLPATRLLLQATRLLLQAIQLLLQATVLWLPAIFLQPQNMELPAMMLKGALPTQKWRHQITAALSLVNDI